MQMQDSSHPTGVVDTSPAGGSEVARARDRKANSALRLKEAGASWEDIAETLGFPTARAALVATEQALERQLKTEESQHYMRQLAGRRLERLLRSVWLKGTNADHPEHLAANARAQAIVAQWTKLHGLDAPSEMVVHSPTAQQLETWVSTVVKNGTPQLEEANIFDVEFTETSDSEVLN